MTYLPPINGGRINATISGNTAGGGALVSSGTLTLAGGNNITLSQNGNAITISGGAAGGASNTFGMSNLGNTIGTSGMISGSALRFAFAGGNNVTLSQSLDAASGTITISAANQTVQTQNLHNVTLSGNTAGAMAHISSGTLTLAGGNNVTLSQNGNAVTVSAASQTVQTQNLHNVTLSGNTAGVMAHVSSGTLTLAGGNNITLSQNGNAITISGGAGGGGGGIALANSETTFTNGTVNLSAAGAMTIGSTTGQSFQLSVPQTSSLSATGILSISTNGSTISIGVPSQGAGVTLSRFEYPEGIFTSVGAVGQGSLSVNHMYVPFNVTGTAMKIGGSLSGSTNTSATTASANVSLWMGIYTLNGSTLSLASSGSTNHNFQWSQTGSSSGNTSINGVRQMTVPINVNMTPGEYWVGAVISSATTYTGAAFSMYGNNLVGNAAGGAALAPIGSNTTVGRGAVLLQGIYTAATSAGPASIANTQINQTSASNVVRANFYNAIYNATY